VTSSVSELHRCGVDPSDIATRLDITKRSVYRHLEAAGVAMTAPDDWRRRRPHEETRE
jgi:hypothetical protein